jgi:hypothetical protein
MIVSSFLSEQFRSQHRGSEGLAPRRTTRHMHIAEAHAGQIGVWRRRVDRLLCWPGLAVTVSVLCVR